FQLFKDVILHLPEPDTAKEQMIKVCRKYYRNNRQFLKQIDEFQEDYHQAVSIDWYTKDGFIYRLINTALRTENIEQLYIFRYYIADLSKQLRDEYQMLKQGNKSMIELYRGTIITRNEVEQLQANVGQLIATNTYWSTSRKKSVAYAYINGCQNDTDRMVVLFQIECNLRNEENSVIFADISGSSNFPEEKEVLFDIGAVFRIESVASETIDKTDVFVVQMKTTNEGKDVLEEYQNQNREEMDVESPTIMLCTILKRMGKCDQSRVLLERLLDHPNGENLVHIHNRLGITYKDEHQYDRALEHFEQALKLTDFSDPSQRKYAAYIFHNKGLLSATRRQLKEALELYEQAITMLKKEISPPNTGIAQFLSSIGRIYFQQRKYQEALQYQQDALQMREESRNCENILPPRVCNHMTSIPLHSKCKKPQWSTQATTVGLGLSQPMGLFIDQYDTVYVTEHGTHSIQHFMQGSTKGILVAGGMEQGSGPMQLNYPSSVFVDKDGNIFVLDTNNFRVQKFSRGNPTGATIVGGRGEGSELFQFGYSYGLFVDDQENIYVSDRDNHRVLTFLRGFRNGTAIISPGELNRPHDIYLDRCNTLYVADFENHRIRKYPNTYQAAGSTIIGVDGQAGSGSQQLNKPYFVTVDRYGNVFVTDRYNHRIQRLSIRDGTLQTIAGITGVAGNSSENLQSPGGIGLDSKGNLYVSDQANNRLQKFAFVSGDLWC
ncbi:unnamed protein product, partial [Adineta steineri]